MDVCLLWVFVLWGRGLCDELITRLEEFYWLLCVVVCDLETSRMRRPWPALGRSAIGNIYMGTAVAQWLRRYATNRKVAGSIPDDVTGFFRWHNPSDRTVTLGSTQPLTEMSTRSISWGKGGGCVWLTILPPSCAVVKKSGNLNYLEPSVPLQACNGTALLYIHMCIYIYIEKGIVRKISRLQEL
jgi:hypothetical protein